MKCLFMECSFAFSKSEQKEREIWKIPRHLVETVKLIDKVSSDMKRQVWTAGNKDCDDLGLMVIKGSCARLRFNQPDTSEIQRTQRNQYRFNF